MFVMIQVLSTTNAQLVCSSQSNASLPCSQELTICQTNCVSDYGAFYLNSECHDVEQNKSICVCYYNSPSKCPK